MERAKLIVKNFGPLKDIEIEVREMVTFIGAQASGKSTLAKLISILEDENFRRYDDIKFADELEKYNMNSYLKKESIIFYSKGETENLYEFKLENKIITKSNPREKLKQKLINSKIHNREYTESLISLDLAKKRFSNVSEKNRFLREFFKSMDEYKPQYQSIKKNLNHFFEMYDKLLSKYGIFVLFDSLYIPSERSFLHLISENTLGLINNNVQIPKHLLNIGQDYEKAIQTIKELPLSIIDKKLRYKREGKTSYIYHNETEKVDLLESASGLQSVIPILLLVEYANSLKEKYNFNFVVEEPELNLYPKAQHELIKYLVKNCLFDRKNLILTTHSPFVLASLNNLLLAFEKGQSKPKESNKIIKKESWLNPKNFIAYQLKNGKAYKIMDDNLGQIKENMIDTISDEFSNEFDKLLYL